MAKNIKEYKNIVFDMGRVLVDYDPDNSTRTFTDDPEIIREVHNLLFCSIEWLAFDLGSISDDIVLERTTERMRDEKVKDIAAKAFWHWHEHAMPEKAGMADVVRELKARGQNVYILSNANHRLVDMWQDVIPAADCFDGTLFSADVLAIKPQPLIYESFFKRFDLEPSDCFFFDDMYENVEASKKCGMDAWQFTSGDAADIRKVLELD